MAARADQHQIFNVRVVALLGSEHHILKSRLPLLWHFQPDRCLLSCPESLERFTQWHVPVAILLFSALRPGSNSVFCSVIGHCFWSEVIVCFAFLQKLLGSGQMGFDE